MVLPSAKGAARPNLVAPAWRMNSRHIPSKTEAARRRSTAPGARSSAERRIRVLDRAQGGVDALGAPDGGPITTAGGRPERALPSR